MSTITSIRTGMSNSGRIPYASAVLDCGHCTDVKLNPSQGACGYCGQEHELPASGQALYCCGRSYFVITYSPHPHNEADRLTQVGERVECVRCRQEQEAVERLRALDRALIHHSRMRHNSYHFYKRDAMSPSGFLLVDSFPVCAKVESALQEMGYSPLSPTEPA